MWQEGANASKYCSQIRKRDGYAGKIRVANGFPASGVWLWHKIVHHYLLLKFASIDVDNYHALIVTDMPHSHSSGFGIASFPTVASISNDSHCAARRQAGEQPWSPRVLFNRPRVSLLAITSIILAPSLLPRSLHCTLPCRQHIGGVAGRNLYLQADMARWRMTSSSVGIRLRSLVAAAVLLASVVSAVSPSPRRPSLVGPLAHLPGVVMARERAARASGNATRARAARSAPALSTPIRPPSNYSIPAPSSIPASTHLIDMDRGRTRTRCPAGCAGAGTCNELTGKCTCPANMGGDGCQSLAAPSCALHPDWVVPCAVDIPKTCACARECDAAMRNPHLFSAPICFEYQNQVYASPEDAPPVESVYRDAYIRSKLMGRVVQKEPKKKGLGLWPAPAPAEEQCLVSNPENPSQGAVYQRPDGTCETLVEKRDVSTRDLFEVLALPLERCPSNCSHHGMCMALNPRSAEAHLAQLQENLANREAVVDRMTGACLCWPGWAGRECSAVDEYAGCLNNCNGRGTCKMGFCVCNRGYWGADCSVFVQDGVPAFVAKDAWQGDGVQRHPPPDVKVFVYDLPPELNDWLHMYYRRVARDFGRHLSWQLHARLLCSRYRTLDPEEADYFYVPAYGESSMDRIPVLEYLKTEYPYYNRERHPDHLMVLQHDGGASKYFSNFVIPDWPYGVPSAYGPYSERVRAPPPPKPGKPPKHEKPLQTPNFLPFQDILVPPTDSETGFNTVSPYYRAQSFTDGAGVGPRKNVLYFSGFVYPDEKPYHIKQPRNQVFAHFGPRSNESFLLVNTRVTGNDQLYWEHHAMSTFCLGLPGKGGGWGRRTQLSVMMGCIPIVIEDNRAQMYDELLPWDTFSLRLTEADIPKLFDFAAEAMKDVNRVASMQRELGCAAMFMRWSSIGTVGEDGRHDAFTALMGTLRRRLKKAVGAGVVNNPVTSACSVIEEAPLIPNMFPGGKGMCDTRWGGLVPDSRYCGACVNGPFICPTCCMGTPEE
eukprot:jgi/Mesvir1/28580/Mv00995-RA.1